MTDTEFDPMVKKIQASERENGSIIIVLIPTSKEDLILTRSLTLHYESLLGHFDVER